MNRIRQIVLIISTIIASWLGMQLVHESGHLLGAGLTGGKVQQVVLSPLTISRTDLSHNPSPLIVVWLGPVVGAAAPVLIWRIAASLGSKAAFVLRFFAGFCLIANGAYLGFGSFDGVGDCGEMLKYGSPIWSLWLFAASTIPCGFWLWHSLGGDFGMGPNAKPINSIVVYQVVITTILLATFGILIGGH